jgi:hypothetical protein
VHHIHATKCLGQKKICVYANIHKKKIGALGGMNVVKLLFKVYLGFTGEESNFNIACPKMTIKTLGQEPKIRVGRL